MAAKTTDMIIRLRDENGVEVTYESGGALGRLLGTSQLSNWANAGAVRSMVRRGVYFYAVLDAAMLKAMTRQESLALGIMRTPEQYRRYSREYAEVATRTSMPSADHHHQEWDDYDLCFVIDAYNAGAKVAEMAKALGRSYRAITNIVDRLRADGDLPETGRGEKPGWQWSVLSMMTAEERAIFLGRKAASLRVAA